MNGNRLQGIQNRWEVLTGISNTRSRKERSVDALQRCVENKHWEQDWYSKNSSRCPATSLTIQDGHRQKSQGSSISAIPCRDKSYSCGCWLWGCSEGPRGETSPTQDTWESGHLSIQFCLLWWCSPQPFRSKFQYLLEFSSEHWSKNISNLLLHVVCYLTFFSFHLLV